MLPSEICDPDIENDVRTMMSNWDEDKLVKELKLAKHHPEYEAYVKAVKLEIGSEDCDDWKFGEQEPDEDLVGLYTYARSKKALRDRLGLGSGASSNTHPAAPLTAAPAAPTLTHPSASIVPTPHTMFFPPPCSTFSHPANRSAAPAAPAVAQAGQAAAPLQAAVPAAPVVAQAGQAAAEPLQVAPPAALVVAQAGQAAELLQAAPPATPVVAQAGQAAAEPLQAAPPAAPVVAQVGQSAQPLQAAPPAVAQAGQAAAEPLQTAPVAPAVAPVAQAAQPLQAAPPATPVVAPVAQAAAQAAPPAAPVVAQAGQAAEPLQAVPPAAPVVAQAGQAAAPLQAAPPAAPVVAHAGQAAEPLQAAPPAAPAVPAPHELSNRIDQVIGTMTPAASQGPGTYTVTPAATPGQGAPPTSSSHRAEYMCFLRAAKNVAKLPESLKDLFTKGGSDRQELFRAWLEKDRDFAQVEILMQRRDMQRQQAKQSNQALSRAQLMADPRYSEEDVKELIARCEREGRYMADPNFPLREDLRQYFVNMETSSEHARVREDSQTIDTRTVTAAAEGLDLLGQGALSAAAALSGS